jgi:hypothetical protein
MTNSQTKDTLDKQIDEIVSHWLKWFVNGSQGITYTAKNISQDILSLKKRWQDESRVEVIKEIGGMALDCDADDVADYCQKMLDELAKGRI